MLKPSLQGCRSSALSYGGTHSELYIGGSHHPTSRGTRSLCSVPKGRQKVRTSTTAYFNPNADSTISSCTSRPSTQECQPALGISLHSQISYRHEYLASAHASFANVAIPSCLGVFFNASSCTHFINGRDTCARCGIQTRSGRLQTHTVKHPRCHKRIVWRGSRCWQRREEETDHGLPVLQRKEDRLRTPCARQSKSEVQVRFWLILSLIRCLP